MRRATLKDIAGRTHLDISTVSRVINNDAGLRISEIKRAEVLQAVRELGYTPHRSARSLRLQRNFTIGYMLNAQAGDEPLRGDMEFPATRYRIYGLEERLSEYGYLIALVRAPANREMLEKEWLRRHPVDGLVFNNTTSLEMIYALQSRLPVVLLDPFLADDWDGDALSHVVVDRAYGVYQAMRRLHESGHHDVAFISVKTNVLRRAGFRQAVQDFGLNADSRLIRLFETPINNLYEARAEGYRVMRELLADGATFSAVQAGSDATAAGAIDALTEAGKRVPQDVVVIGYDDLEGYGFSLFPKPFLTTLRDPNVEIGRQAADLLIAQIERDARPERCVVQPEMVVRASA